MLHICRTLVLCESVKSEMARVGERPVIRAAALAVISNPLAGRYTDDLSELFEAGRMIGEQLMPEQASLRTGTTILLLPRSIVHL